MKVRAAWLVMGFLCLHGIGIMAFAMGEVEEESSPPPVINRAASLQVIPANSRVSLGYYYDGCLYPKDSGFLLNINKLSNFISSVVYGQEESLLDMDQMIRLAVNHLRGTFHREMHTVMKTYLKMEKSPLDQETYTHTYPEFSVLFPHTSAQISLVENTEGKFFGRYGVLYDRSRTGMFPIFEGQHKMTHEGTELSLFISKAPRVSRLSHAFSTYEIANIELTWEVPFFRSLGVRSLLKKDMTEDSFALSYGHLFEDAKDVKSLFQAIQSAEDQGQIVTLLEFIEEIQDKQTIKGLFLMHEPEDKKLHCAYFFQDNFRGQQMHFYIIRTLLTHLRQREGIKSIFLRKGKDVAAFHRSLLKSD